MSEKISSIVSQYNLRRQGVRWVGACPMCGGSKGSDKFNLFADGGFKCYGCDFSGSHITWLRKMEGMSCPDAHEAAGLDCSSSSCPVYSTCRLGDGSGRRSAGSGRARRRPRSPQVPPRQPERSLPQVDSSGLPVEQWRRWGTELLGKSIQAMRAQKVQLEWLLARGIDGEAVSRFHLGWLEHDRTVVRREIGLAEFKNGKPKLWVPGGLLIPIFSTDGQLHRLRVRRTPEARQRFLSDRKYVWIEGSGPKPMVIAPDGVARGAVIVEAELDAMAVAAACPEVLVIAVGTVRGGVHKSISSQLSGLPVILVALDAEPGKNGKPGSGPEAVKVWERSYRQAKYWPVPDGKDPGDYVLAGGDLGKWVRAGLPPKASGQPQQDLQPGPPLPAEPPPEVLSQSQDLSFRPEIPQGGMGERDSLPLQQDPEWRVETVPELRWCAQCYGDLFLESAAGGRFCVACQPIGKPGRLVRAGKPREKYVHV